jgi:recombinational DNA repair protein RecR
MSSAIAWGTYHIVKGVIDPTNSSQHWNLTITKLV